MTSNNSNKHKSTNYQGGGYQGSSAPRAVPSSSLSAAAAGQVSSTSGGPTEDSTRNAAPESGSTPNNNTAPTQARGNVTMNPYHQQQQQQQQAAMYRQHYGPQSYHHMNPYQHQIYMQQQQQQHQQRLYMMQQQQQQQRQQQFQQHPNHDSSNIPKANTPVTVYRSSYYAAHGNAPAAATVPPVNWQAKNNATSSSSSSTGTAKDATNGSTKTDTSTNANSNSNNQTSTSIPTSSMLHPTYPTQQSMPYNSHPRHNPYMAGGTRVVNASAPTANAAPLTKPKKKCIITDKKGIPIDLTGVSPTGSTKANSTSSSTSSSTNTNSQKNTDSNTHTTANTSTLTSTASSAAKKEDAGAKMRAIAERNIKENLNARAERERLEKERLEKEQFEKERVEKERLEKERMEKERMEKERLEKERLMKERIEKERLEKLKLEKQKMEKERLEKERVQKELERERNKSPVPPVSRVGLRPGGFRPGGGSSSSGLRPGGPLRPGGGRPSMSMQASGSDGAPSMVTSGVKRTYTKTEIIRFRDLPTCCDRPADLPDMTITTSSNQSGSNHRGQGGRGHNRPSWARGNTPSNQGGPPRNGGNHNHHPRGQQGNWSRGKAPPPQRPHRGGRDKQGGRGNNRYQQQSEYTGPVAPLVKSDNRWMPQKNNSVMVASEKKVKGILNKMTKEKFSKLSNQMCEIPILSYEMLTLMIHKVYEKAIYEPAFGDMYADLCCRLADNVSPDSIINVIRSNEPKPDMSAIKGKELERWQKYDGGDTWRWTNDVATDDNEVVGPFDSIDECHSCALNGTGEPSPRGETILKLIECTITDGVFCKVSIDESSNKYYAVYFPVQDAESCNQQLSQQFPSEEACKSDALKQNSFKRTLLNKCEDEFNKQDIYIDWKKENEEYESGKGKLTEKERAETEAELSFRRMNIKKQMLGNIKFIGELYKKNMIREHIMHFCIQSLLKIKDDDDKEDEEMDEEDHEALCNLFTTIGKHIDAPKNSQQLKTYFRKMKQLSEDEKNLSFRSRFMYKDLIDLRNNRWKVRREELKAKTINEIRKEAAREEREKEKQSAYNNRNYDNRGGRGSSNRRESSAREKSRPVVDSAGFTQVSHGRSLPHGTQQSLRKPSGAHKSKSSEKPRRVNNSSSVTVAKRAKETTKAPPAPKAPKFEPLTEEKFDLRSKNILSEFTQDPKNTSELFLSFDELTGTEDAGKKFVQKCIDRIVDLKMNEIPIMVSMLQILYEGKKIVPSDIEFGLGETIEFLDSFVYDCPKIFTYIADIVSKFVHVKALTVAWLCEITGKMNSMKEKLIEETVQCMKSEFGAEETSSVFLKNEASLIDVIGQSDWNNIKGTLV